MKLGRPSAIVATVGYVVFGRPTVRSGWHITRVLTLLDVAEMVWFTWDNDQGPKRLLQVDERSNGETRAG